MQRNYEKTKFALRLAILIMLNVLIVAFAGYALSRYMARAHRADAPPPYSAEAADSLTLSVFK